jgi:hypothetical protein
MPVMAQRNLMIAPSTDDTSSREPLVEASPHRERRRQAAKTPAWPGLCRPVGIYWETLPSSRRLRYREPRLLGAASVMRTAILEAFDGQAIASG